MKLKWKILSKFKGHQSRGLLLLLVLIVLALALGGSFAQYTRYFVYTNKAATYKVFVNQVPEQLYTGPHQALTVRVHKPLDGLDYVTWLSVQVQPEEHRGESVALEAASENPDYLSLDNQLIPDIVDFKALSNQLVRPEDSTVQRAESFMKWIHKNVSSVDGISSKWILPPGQDYTDDRKLFGVNAKSAEYASAFSGLMRAQGIPTRTVGGHIFMDETNTLYIWNEIWLADRGWVTVDVLHRRWGADNRYIRFYDGPDYTAYIEKLTTLRFGVERTNW